MGFYGVGGRKTTQKHMNRREFIGALGLGAAYWLAACRKKDEPEASFAQKAGKVAVVGAGIAGLHVAWRLSALGVEVVVFEKLSRIGGRILTDKILNDGKPLELGAEFVHGEKSAWHQALRDAGVALEPVSDDYRVFYQGQIFDARAAQSHPDLSRALALVDNLESLSGSGSVKAAAGLPDALDFVLDGRIGADYGADIARLGARELAEAERLWTAGENDFRVSIGMADALNRLYADVLGRVRTQSAVSKIAYSSEGVTLTVNGQEQNFDRVVVTVPLGVLKRGEPTFDPPLPNEKRAVIQGLGMGAGMKVVYRFRERFWPSDMHYLVGGRHAPLFWVSGDSVLTALVVGKYADDFVRRLQADPSGILPALDDLDQAFSGAARPLFKDQYVQDWTPLGGAYSYPTPGFGSEARETLAEPLEDRVFFAGEAVHTGGHFATVHGARETADSVVEQLRALI
ncbi:MAG: FAD-dependent oxidoreductase [Bacteroidia bacterium]|nr:FAD-dependent oxidoreductase [Bacteroidia bacterium]